MPVPGASHKKGATNKYALPYVAKITTKTRLKLQPHEHRGQDLAGKRHLYLMTLKEVAKRLGISSERVRQIERGALRKLAYALGPWRQEFIDCGLIPNIKLS